MSITITLNGKPHTLQDELSLQDLLEQNGYNGKTVAIAVNKNFIPKSSYDTHTISEDDEIEIVAPMQGG